MAFRVIVSDSLSEEGMQVFARFSRIEVDDRAGIDRSELLRVIADYDALVVRSRTKADAEVIAAGRKLKLIGRAGIGVDNVDVRAATRAGVVVMNTPDGNATTTAEHTIALIFSVARMVPQADASMKAGKWEKQRFMGRELRGKTIGIIGLGNIGQIVADRAHGLQMKVVGFDPYMSADKAADKGVEMLALNDLVRRSDIITVHTPLNDQTRGLIGSTQIDLMKQGVLLINCARGGIYDEAALLKGLEAGRIGGVALDVFTTEPPPADHPLVRHERVVCTPHLGASTSEAQVQVAIDIAEQIGEFEAGGPARNAVNLPRVSAAELKKVAPYLDLAQRMGSFCQQLIRGAVTRLELRLTGELGGASPELLVTAAVAGALQGALDRPVNFVNARVLAKERGLEIVESRAPAGDRGFAGTVSVSLRGAQESHSVVGALFDGERSRFVEVDGIALEAVPSGDLLLIHNYDTPGVIGHIGQVLGDAKINISRMHLGLSNDSGKALAIVNIDGPAPDAVLERLHTGNVIWVRQAHL